MQALLQRVQQAQVTVDNQIVGAINYGCLVFLGVEKEDSVQQVQKMVERVLNYRIFSDSNQQMNLSLLDKKGELCVVSQFTLAADTRKGLRPSFTPAAHPILAKNLYEAFVEKARTYPIKVATGQFGAQMAVSLINDGPVTFLLKV